MYIALTFDDGPNLSTTPKVLDILEYYGVKASFFVVGKNITNETVGVVRRAVKLGCSIENHSWTHSAFPELNPEMMQKEVLSTNEIIKKATGKQAQFFRPPYIAVCDQMYDVIKMPFICGQGIDDWKVEIPANVKARNVVEKSENGQIILLHDSEGNDTTVDALKIIIPALQTLGFDFCTVGELFSKMNVKPDVPKKIWTRLNQK